MLKLFESVKIFTKALKSHYLLRPYGTLTDWIAFYFYQYLVPMGLWLIGLLFISTNI